MKKQFLFLFFLFISALSFAQSSLDSLRLVLPEDHSYNSRIGLKHNSISFVVFSPDGKYLLVASEDDTHLLLYETRSGKLVNKLVGHKSSPNVAVFSPDSKKIFTSANRDSSKYIWDLYTGKIEKEIIENNSWILSAEFSSDGNWLLTNSRVYNETPSSKVWSLSMNRKNNGITIPGVNIMIKFEGFSDNILTFDINGRLNFWKLKNCIKNKLNPDWSIEVPIASTTEDVNSYKIRCDSKLNKLVFSDSPYRYFIVDCRTKEVNLFFCEALLVNTQSSFALVKSRDSDSTYFNIEIFKGEFLDEIKLPRNGIKSILYHPNAKKIMVFNDDFSCSYWDLHSGECEWSSLNQSYKIKDFFWLDYTTIFNPRLNQFVELDDRNEIQIWDMNLKRITSVISSKLVDLYSYYYLKKNKQLAFYSNSGDFELVDEKNGLQLVGFKTSQGIFNGGSIEIDSNEQILLAIDSDYQLHLYSLKKSAYLMSFNTNLPEYTMSGGGDGALSPDGNYVLGFNSISGSGAERDSLENFSIFSLKNPESIRFLKYSGLKKSPKYFDFSIDGRYCLAQCRDTSPVILVWDTKSDNLVCELRPGLTFVKTQFSNKGDFIACQTYGDKLNIYNYLTGKLTHVFKVDGYDNEPAFKFKNNSFILAVRSQIYSNSNGRIVLYNFQTGDSITQINTDDFNPKFEFAVYKEYLAFTSSSNSVSIFDLNKNESIANFTYAKSKPSSLLFCNDDKVIAINYLDNKTVFFDIETQKPIYERIQLENNNWLVKLPNSPYYMCSKDASKMLHYVTPSLKVIGFEQLDPVYNRPDIVLDSIGKYFGGADQEMVANYRQSWEKRIDRLGLDKEKLGKGEIAVPSAEIVGADTIAYDNKEGKLNIKVSANDSKYPLRRFNVFINEVPLYGSAGISIAHLKKQVWDTTVNVPLSVGENKIQVSVMNELGLENFKYPTYVNYTPEKEIVAKTHYIGIGVNEFKEPGHKLNYCVKDVRDLAKAFSAENKNVDTLLFTDKQVNKENILALKDYLNKTSVNDKVIISCSSHGLLDENKNFYLATYDVDFNSPQARGLKYEELESLLDGIPARQKLLLLDACNSGENDKTEVLKQELQQKEKSMDSTELLAARGVIIKLEQENKSNFKKMNELFVNVRNNTGSVIISAAGGQESALEAIKVDGKTIENGAFTYSILECLKQNEGKELKVNVLKQYAEKRVEEITNGKQKPTSRQETMEVDWGVR